jgi:hypothetical protein
MLEKLMTWLTRVVTTNKLHILGGILCLFLGSTVIPVQAEITPAPQLVAQFWDIGPSPPPTQFAEVIPLKNQDPKKRTLHLFEWHPRLIVVYDGHKTRHYYARVRAIVKSLGLKKSDLAVYGRNVSSIVGRRKLLRDKLPARDILGPLPVMNITSGENEPLVGLHSDAEIRHWIKNRMGLR